MNCRFGKRILLFLIILEILLCSSCAGMFNDDESNSKKLAKYLGITENTATTSGSDSESDEVGSLIYNSSGKAVGIVAGKRSDGYYIAIGLQIGSMCNWLSNSSVSTSKSYTDMLCLPWKNNKLVWEGQRDGSSGWSVVYKTDGYSISNYPAFNYACSYNTTSSSSYTWYLPSTYELYVIHQNMEKLNTKFNELGYGANYLTYRTYWSSTQDSSRVSSDAGDYYFSSDGTVPSDLSSSKTGESKYVLAVTKAKSFLTKSSSDTDTTTSPDSTKVYTKNITKTISDSYGSYSFSFRATASGSTDYNISRSNTGNLSYYYKKTGDTIYTKIPSGPYTITASEGEIIDFTILSNSTGKQSFTMTITNTRHEIIVTD